MSIIERIRYRLRSKENRRYVVRLRTVTGDDLPCRTGNMFAGAMYDRQLGGYVLREYEARMFLTERTDACTNPNHRYFIRRVI